MDLSESKRQMIGKVPRLFPTESIHFKLKAIDVITNNYSDSFVEQLLKWSEYDQSGVVRYSVDGSVMPPLKAEAADSPLTPSKHASNNISRTMPRSRRSKLADKCL